MQKNDEIHGEAGPFGAIGLRWAVMIAVFFWLLSFVGGCTGVQIKASELPPCASALYNAVMACKGVVSIQKTAKMEKKGGVRCTRSSNK